MARFPGAIWRPIPENTTQPLVRITQVIMHVRAGTGDSLFGLWTSPGNGLESHFYVRYDGTVEQYMDTARSADANLTANLRPDGTGAMSIETEGLGEGEWTAAQVTSLLALARWANKVHGVPLRVCPGPNDPGIGYHIMFGTPGPWTPVSKSCPGPARIVQWRGIIMPALTSGVDPEGDDMTAEQIAALRQDIHTDMANMLSDSTHMYLPPLHAKLQQTATDMRLLKTTVDALAAKVQAVPVVAGNPEAIGAAVEAAMWRVLAVASNRGGTE
jgi:hypothetical protein